MKEPLKDVKSLKGEVLGLLTVWCPRTRGPQRCGSLRAAAIEITDRKKGLRREEGR